MITYVYIPGAYVNVHDPPRGTSTGGAGVAAGAVTGDEGVLGLLAGFVAVVGGVDAHAVINAA